MHNAAGAGEREDSVAVHAVRAVEEGELREGTRPSPKSSNRRSMLGGKISNLASFLPFRASVVLGSRKKSSEEWQAHVSKVYGGGTLPPGWEHLDGLRQMQQTRLPGKTRLYTASTYRLVFPCRLALAS